MLNMQYIQYRGQLHTAEDYVTQDVKSVKDESPPPTHVDTLQNLPPSVTQELFSSF